MLGFPAPQLQTPCYDRDGLIGYVDCWWPESGIIGEFDGHAKYVRPELRGGKSPGAVTNVAASCDLCGARKARG